MYLMAIRIPGKGGGTFWFCKLHPESQSKSVIQSRRDAAPTLTQIVYSLMMAPGTLLSRCAAPLDVRPHRRAVTQLPASAVQSPFTAAAPAAIATCVARSAAGDKQEQRLVGSSVRQQPAPGERLLEWLTERGALPNPPVRRQYVIVLRMAVVTSAIRAGDARV